MCLKKSKWFRSQTYSLNGTRNSPKIHFSNWANFGKLATNNCKNRFTQLKLFFLHAILVMDSPASRLHLDGSAMDHHRGNRCKYLKLEWWWGERWGWWGAIVMGRLIDLSSGIMGLSQCDGGWESHLNPVLWKRVGCRSVPVVVNNGSQICGTFGIGGVISVCQRTILKENFFRCKCHP